MEEEAHKQQVGSQFPLRTPEKAWELESPGTLEVVQYKAKNWRIIKR